MRMIGIPLTLTLGVAALDAEESGPTGAEAARSGRINHDPNPNQVQIA
jgi:hypothetical protein